uniref:Gamma-tubulin complex component n=1 Tax=Lygus hesperus TaxID=30085 RepID=A0A0A9Y775_LYGHE
MSGQITPAEVPQFYSRLAQATVEVQRKKEKEGRDTGDKLELTDWRSERPNMTMDFSNSRVTFDLIPSSTLEHVPHTSQEHVVVQELLKVFVGGESEYMNVQYVGQVSKKWELFVSPTIDQLNFGFVMKCLPMAANYSVIAGFVEDSSRLSCGRVNQALGDGMDRQLAEYLLFIESLETKNRLKLLHLHEVWYHIQKSFSTLKLLSDIAKEVTEKKTRGGGTLSLLNDHLLKMLAPVAMEIEICRLITAHSAIPYMESVKQWIFNGMIYDPFDEFMIVENPKWKKKDYMEGYWEKMYQLRHQLVPNFLEDVKYYILNSGKYLNVIRECVKSEKEMNLAPVEDLPYTEDKTYYDVIFRAYKHSSKSLLDYMMNEFCLMDRITTAKRYFLLQQGDFVVQLLDTCHEELDKNINDINPSRLATLVEMAIRSGSSKGETDTEQFTSCLKPMDLGSQVRKILVECIPSKTKEDQDSSVLSESADFLTGYESFMLSMTCEWPVSLVFNTKVQSVYQMLFRHLFYCKYIERLLSCAWTRGQELKGKTYKAMGVYSDGIALCNRMTFFLQNMEYYMMEEAIEPAWAEFIEVVKNCESVDDLMKYHWNFQEKCTQDCLLTNLELLSDFRRILSLCKEFGSTWRIKDTDESWIKDLEERFNESLIIFLTKITQLSESDSTGKLLNLFYRQNYNHYYDSILQNADTDALMDSLRLQNY